MPLRGYLSTSNRGRIATLGSVAGDKTRRKKIRFNTMGGNEAQLSVYVQDCASHEPMGVVVPVELVTFTPGVGWEELGVAKCCPLCWYILISPEGIDLPEPSLWVSPKKQLNEKQKTALARTRQKKKSSGRPRGSKADQSIQNFIDLGEEFSIQDIMASTGLVRTGIRKILLRMVKEDLLEIIHEGGGRDNRSLFIKRAP